VTCAKGGSFAIDLNRFVREDAGCVEKRAMVLAAIQAMAESNAVGLAGGRDADVAAKASAS
jgi:hypothetical protein